MIRQVTSLTALLSFVLLMLSGIVLYIVPAGRVAYWADYHLWGLTKTQWGNLHINLGFLFFLTILVHTWLNRKAIAAYLKDKTRQFKLFTAHFNAALVIALIFAVGTFYEIPPFSTITAIGESFSNEANTFYGEPPYGHAELSSLQTFTKKLGLDHTLSVKRLKNAGIEFENSGQTLKQIAQANNLPPNEIYLTISPPEERAKSFPQEPPPGLGKRPLIDLCQEYSVSIKIVLGILAEHGVEAREDMSIKEIAARAGKDPHSIYELIQSKIKER